MLIGAALLLGTPFFIFFGWLSDQIGRLKIILAGCLIAALTYFSLFHALTHYVNPALEAYAQKTTITVSARDCNFHWFVGPWSKFSDCDKAKDFLTKQGLSFQSLRATGDDTVVSKINDVELKGWDEAKYKQALFASGYPGIDEQGKPKGADKRQINYGMTLLILFIMLIYVTMVYGPIAAFLVELLPTRIRYTSMSLPYHIGNGVFGGLTPFIATLLTTMYTADKLMGLRYPIIVAGICLI